MKKKYVENFKKVEGIQLDLNKINRNEGARSVAKLALNSFWGKFAQRNDVTKTVIIKEANKLYELLLNPEIEVKSILTINPETILVKWIYLSGNEALLKHTNVVIASYTTAMARLCLLEYLERLGKNVYYNDTDSLIYLSPEGPPLIETGEYLGDMTNELFEYGKNAYIDTFISGGCKNYSYWVTNPDTGERFNVTKVKGFRLNVSNEKIINSENLKALLGVEQEPILPLNVPIPRHIARLPDHTVVSVNQHKTYRVTVDKVRVLPNFETVPYGYFV